MLLQYEVIKHKHCKVGEENNKPRIASSDEKMTG